jgi:hypothetical protein
LIKDHHHHLPINVPISEAQAFLMDYPQGERAISTRAQCGLVVANDCKYSPDQRCFPKHRGARDDIYWLPIRWSTNVA